MQKIKLLLGLLICSCACQVIAQKEYNIWYFSDAGLDFNSGQAIAIDNNQNASCYGISSSICNKDGRLLFYTNGDSFWDSTHQLMPNGSGNGFFSNGAFIIPRPETPNHYFVLLSNIVGKGNSISLQEVDMTLNNGKGGVLNYKKILKKPVGTNDFGVIVGHANGKDYWWISSDSTKTKVISRKITVDGIDSIAVENDFRTNDSTVTSAIAVSPNGKFIVVKKQFKDSSYLCDLDIETGIIKNRIAFATTNPFVFEFSMTSKFLYFNDWENGEIIQYDLQVKDKSTFPSTRKVVSNGLRVKSLQDLALGPDGKIYFSYYFTDTTNNHAAYIHVIQYPDSPGVKCMPTIDAIYLKNRHACFSMMPIIPSFYYNKIHYNRNCSNDTTFFTISNSEIDSAHWNFGDFASGNLNKFRGFQNVYHSYKDTGHYRVQLITFYSGIQDTFTRTVYISDSKPHLGKDEIYCNNTSILHKLKPNKNFLTYQWSTGKTTAFINANTKGTYWLRVTDTTGCTSSDTITIETPVVRAIIGNVDTLVCLNSTRLTFKNKSNIFYTHQKSSKFIFDDSTEIIDTVADFTFNSIGYHKVKLLVETEESCMDSAEMFIYVSPLPKSSFKVSDTIACFSKNSFDFQNLTVDTFPQAFTFHWDFGDSTFDNAKNIFNKKYDTFGQFTINLIVSSKNGICTDTSARTISVYSDPKAQFNVSDTQSCLIGNSFDFINMSQGSLDSIIWDFGDGSRSFSTNVLGKKFTNPGVYNVKIRIKTLESCSDSSNQTINVFENVAVNFLINNDSQCLKGNLFDFMNTSTISQGEYKFRWNFGDGDFDTINNKISKKYLVDSVFLVSLSTVTDRNCRDTVVKSIHVLSHPNLNFDITTKLPCTTDLKLDLSTSNTIKNGVLNNKIDWGDGEESGFIGNANLNHIYDQKGIYTIKLTSLNSSCTDTFIKIVELELLPKGKITASGICLGDSTLLEAKFTNLGGNYLYNWEINQDVVQIAGNQFKILFPNIGEYNIKVSTGSADCEGSDSMKLYIFEKPVANFIFTHMGKIAGGHEIKFIDNSKGANQWNWSFGNFGTSLEKNPSFIFKDTGRFMILLIASNQGKCFDSSSLLLPVLDKLVFYFPTAFSPDNNGLNESFGLNKSQLMYVNEYEILIYNRWGEKVFQTKNKDEQWQASDVQQGIYIYKVYLRDLYNILHEIRGVVEVLR